MESQKALLVTGNSGSGKSSFSEVVGKMYNVPVISVGKVMRTYAKCNGFKSLTEFLRKNGTAMGFEIVRNPILKQVKNSAITSQNGCVVVDGVYDEAIYYYLKSRLGFDKVMLVNVKADYDTRMNRIMLRNGMDSYEDAMLEMLRRDSTKDEVGLGNLIRMADITVTNNLDRHDLEFLAKYTMKKLLNG